MTVLLTKIKNFMRPVDYSQVESLKKTLGECPSISTLEEVLKYYKKQQRDILTKDLLEWMNENEQESFVTDDMKVTIRTNVSAKIMDPSIAFKWLENQDYGDLIKDTLDFPKGELTPEAEGALEQLGLSYTKKSGVHAQSLKKIMKDRLESGEMLPDEGDGIQVGYFDECVVKEK